MSYFGTILGGLGICEALTPLAQPSGVSLLRIDAQPSHVH